MKSNETLSGFIPTSSLVGSGKDKQPYKEKSKDKSKKKDYKNERARKEITREFLSNFIMMKQVPQDYDGERNLILE